MEFKQSGKEVKIIQNPQLELTTKIVVVKLRRLITRIRIRIRKDRWWDINQRGGRWRKVKASIGSDRFCSAGYRIKTSTICRGYCSLVNASTFGGMHVHMHWLVGRDWMRKTIWRHVCCHVIAARHNMLVRPRLPAWHYGDWNAVQSWRKTG